MNYSTSVHDAMKEFIQNNEGVAFHKLQQMFLENIVYATLELTNGNKSKASEMLGISRVAFRGYCDRTRTVGEDGNR